MNFVGYDLASPVDAALLLAWQSLFTAMLALSVICGAVAVVSPKRFQKLADYSARWIETDGISKWLDRRIDLDGYVLRHPRAFGAITSVSSIYLIYRWIVG